MALSSRAPVCPRVRGAPRSKALKRKARGSLEDHTMRRKGSLLTIAAFIAVLGLQVPPSLAGDPYSLQESIKEALENNLGLQAKLEKIAQATHLMKQARAEFFPKLGMTYGYARQSEQITFRSTLMPGAKIAVSSQDNYEWRGTVSQPLFTGFALLSSYELAKLGIDQSELELELTRLDLALKVKEAYFNILVADKGIEVAQKDVEARRSNLTVARSFYEVGMIPVNDLLRAEVELANSRQQLVKGRNAARLARAAFNTVLSRPLEAPVAVEDILVYKPEVGEFEAYVQEAFKNRPEMQLLDVNIQQAKQQIRLAASKFYPEVALNYDYIKEGDKADVSGSPFHDANRWQFSAGLSWNFFEWGKTHYKVEEKESLRRELAKTKKALEDQIRLEVKQAMLDLATAEENIPTTQKAVEQGEENLRVNQERYKAQVTTITEVLDAHTLLTRARVDYFRALYDHNLARARLERALGTY